MRRRTRIATEKITLPLDHAIAELTGDNRFWIFEKDDGTIEVQFLANISARITTATRDKLMRQSELPSDVDPNTDKFRMPHCYKSS